jgi:hypothetical protein
MVQPSIPTAMILPARRPSPLPADAVSAHDEVLLVAALERIELTRQTLEDLLSAGLSGLLFA